ncbi:MAG: hypothetical protein WAL53_03710, partial [Nitrososphaeraceae archaeon]
CNVSLIGCFTSLAIFADYYSRKLYQAELPRDIFGNEFWLYKIIEYYDTNKPRNYLSIADKCP